MILTASCVILCHTKHTKCQYRHEQWKKSAEPVQDRLIRGLASRAQVNAVTPNRTQTLLGASPTAAAVSLRDNSSDPSLVKKRGFLTTNILYLGKTIKQLLSDVQVLLSNDNPIESFPNENILEKKIYKI